MRLTAALLIYRSPRWLRFVLDGLERASLEHELEVLVVANDAAPIVIDALAAEESRSLSDSRRPGIGTFRWVDFRNADPTEYDMARVYRAWNEAMSRSETEDVVLLNSDMYGEPGWIDWLADAKARDEKVLPTALLVERGRITSGLPQFVADFGVRPEEFRREKFLEYAAVIRRRYPPHEILERGLFMPLLLRRSEWSAVGGYPIQGPGWPEAADAVFFGRLSGALGLKHRTVCSSIVYHAQRGEGLDETVETSP